MKLYLLLTAFAILLIAGCAKSTDLPVASPMPVPDQPNTPETTAGSEITVEITEDGFSPKTVSIKAGDTVTFVNRDIVPHWPASAMHPEHTAYPGSDIKKCGTPEQAGIFDACKELAQGESFSFTFNEKGSWGYHDHLNPTLWGTINVSD